MPHAPCLPLFLALAVTTAFAQNATRTTVAFANSNPTGEPPRSLSWSPDGARLTFVATDTPTLAHIGNPGDIVQIDARTGKASVLATAAQLNALSSGPISEKDQDHRDRYGADFLWSDDSKHLVLDKGGHLWLYFVADATSTLLVDTGVGSGDDPKFSPDAHFVSFLRGHDLYLHPVADKAAKDTALTATTSDALLNGEIDWVYLEELNVRSNYFWSPDSSAIAYLQADESKVPVYPIADWIPRHTTVDPQRYPQPGDPNPAVRIGVVPIKGKDAGTTRFVHLPVSAGNDYIPRFGWIDPTTLYIEVLTRDQRHLNLYFADTRTGASRLVYTDTDPKYLDESYDLTFLGNGRFLAPSWRDGHTQLYLYQFDTEHLLTTQATLVRQLTHGDFEVESVTGFDSKSNTVFYTSTEGSPLQNNLWSIRLDGSDKQRLTTTAGVHNVQLSPDNTHFADIASNSTTPPVASLCTLHKGCTPFWNSTPIPAAAGVTSSTVTFTAADGKTTLYGTLTLSATTGAASTPLILNPYGGPLPTAGARNDWNGGRLFDEILAQHGFAVLQVDNRGSGGRGRDFQQAAFHTFGPVQFADQMAALDQTLAKYPQLDPKRIGWWGWSWGGSFTLYAMTHTGRIRAGVAIAPVTDWHNYDSIYTERYLGLPSGDGAAIYTTDAPITHAADLKGRLLIAQGTGDDNVHIANTIQFLEPLINAGIPYDLQLFPRKTHSIAGTESRDELFNRILSQFETYLK